MEKEGQVVNNIIVFKREKYDIYMEKEFTHNHFFCLCHPNLFFFLHIYFLRLQNVIKTKLCSEFLINLRISIRIPIKFFWYIEPLKF